MILSVPHTGTRFLTSVTGYTHMHSYEYMTPQDLINRNGDEVLCSPLRDPWEVWKTWAQRYCAPGRQYLMDPDHPKSMESAWRGMAALDRYFDIVYVPIDVPEHRDRQLELLAEKMGTKLDTDWVPVSRRADHKRRKPVPDRDLDWIYRLPFVERFYGVRV